MLLLFFQIACLNALLQVEHLFLDLLHDLEKSAVLLAAGVVQSPILPMGTGQSRTLNIAAHGDHEIHRRQIGERFAPLCLFHVDAVDLFHQAYRVGIDLGTGFGSG